jgi:hypothetical protein
MLHDETSITVFRMLIRRLAASLEFGSTAVFEPVNSLGPGGDDRSDSVGGVSLRMRVMIGLGYQQGYVSRELMQTLLGGYLKRKHPNVDVSNLSSEEI